MLFWYLGIPKLLRFVSISPRTVEFRVTENCNGRCIMCNAWKNKSVDELNTEEKGELKEIVGTAKHRELAEQMYMRQCPSCELMYI